MCKSEHFVCEVWFFTERAHKAECRILSISLASLFSSARTVWTWCNLLVLGSFLVVPLETSLKFREGISKLPEFADCVTVLELVSNHLLLHFLSSLYLRNCFVLGCSGNGLLRSSLACGCLTLSKWIALPTVTVGVHVLVPSQMSQQFVGLLLHIIQVFFIGNRVDTFVRNCWSKLFAVGCFLLEELLRFHFRRGVGRDCLRSVLGPSRHVMDVLEMSAKISTLSEGLSTVVARERSLTSVLSEMVSEVATFLKGTITVRVLAFKEQLDTLRCRVLHFNSLMPLFRDTNKGLGFWVCHVLVVVGGVRVFLRIYFWYCFNVRLWLTLLFRFLVLLFKLISKRFFVLRDKIEAFVGVVNLLEHIIEHLPLWRVGGHARMEGSWMILWMSLV